MKVLTTIADFRRAHATLGSASLGFVPTMGFLHDGHLEMIKRARAENDGVAASIFVNPLQFAPTDDLEAYPRDFERDRSLLEQAGCALLFHPDVVEVYPDGADLDITVVPNRIASVLEGASRPVHFTGVATVVTKLFNIVQPDVACFGEKDFQQLAVIRKMVEDLAMDIEIIGVPTVREMDGLAMSSRNGLLTIDERQRAPVLARTMRWISSAMRGGRDDYASVIEDANDQLRAAGLQPDEIFIRDARTLQAITAETTQAVILMSAFLGKARLIDNQTVDMAVETKEEESSEANSASAE